MAMRNVIPCVSCLVFGGVAGYQLRPSPGAAVSTPAQAQAAAGKASGLSGFTGAGSLTGPEEGRESKKADKAKEIGGPGAVASLGERLKDLMDHFNNKDARKAADDLSAAELQAALGLLTAMPKSSERDSLRGVLFQAWAKKDGPAAWKAALAESTTTEASSLTAVAEELAKTRPEAVLGMAMGLGKGGRRTEVLQAVTAAWSKNDPTGALAYLAKHPELPVPYWCVGQVVLGMADKDPSQAAKLASSLPDPQAQRYALSNVLGRWAKTDPQAALGWAQSITSAGTRQSAISQTISGWAGKDPQAAMAAALALGDPSMRSDAMRSGWSTWFQNSPEEAVQYLATAGAATLTTSQSSNLGWIFSNTTSGMTTEETASLVKQLPEGKFKDDILSSMASSKVYNGHYTQALELLNGLPDSSNRDSSVQQLGRQWGDSDPDAAAAWLRQQPDSSDRDVAVSGFVTSLAHSDPKGALQWADTISDEGVKTSALKNILVRWLVSDPTAAGAWLTASSAFTNEDKQDLRSTAEGGHGSITYGVKVTNRR